MNGLLLINKPEGITSHDVVARVRRILQTREVGHSGTLDPLASGLMVLLIGEATKLSSFVTEGDKSYCVGIKLGVTTDTLDITGQVLTEKQIQCSDEAILGEAMKIQGELSLPIPMFSAKKIDGKKLYEYAREGEAVTVPEKVMKFWNIENVANTPKELKFHLACSKGSFIRSWVSLLGDNLGCGAAMASLVRTKSHHYKLEEAITLPELEALTRAEQTARLVPLDQALPGIKSVRIKGQDAVLMKNGQISHSLRTQLICKFNPDLDQIIQILPEQRGHILALVGLEKGQGFKIKRVFNYTNTLE
ncbi:MAG: tRNA pseudouridine(55) synthase TruB [Bdellovibrionaceae bacterium]|nr:tRNA pseudouridine(55) synthase TruB [Bdellovibrio sp.]